MVDHEIVRALRRFLDHPVPEDGSVALFPMPMTYAELIACGLINRAIGVNPDANHASAIIADMLTRASEFDPARLDD